MSGIEVAGLVLGAIPLVLSALEHYEDIIGPTKAFVRFQGELDRAIRELRNQHTLFEQSIEVLLRPITTDQELSFGKDSAIEDKLRRKLGNAYPSYMRTIDDIQSIMIGIAMKLDNVHGVENLDRNGLEAIISQHVAAKVDGKLQKFEMSKRMKFTMKKKKIKQSLLELQRYIEMLDKFQVKADKITTAEELYNSDSRVMFTLPLDIVRENAKKLYKVLSKTWSTREEARERTTWLATESATFVQMRYKLLWPVFATIIVLDLEEWLDVEIRLLEYSASGQQSGSAVQTTISASPSSSVTTTLAPLPCPNPSQLQIVTDLCSILQNPCHPCIGFCLDGEGHLRGAYNAQRSVAYVDGGASLEDVLTNNGLDRQEQYNLSITLTSSMLQLSHTPWLQETWSKADIIFLRAK
ncbi:hypothetical protein A1O3_09345 [Capronia epimyces CBS 606.96]|uniref:Prion-inhibition and propagation HeLo domain-containing protein n=1 Tax=Capronia epimyces CBS 606.96 TaxID=1182542 RepID=W9Y6Y8_9EURO|nr:uncharacterized protein A1O3_09345 [Capronia epimyces CBS 606.96]EXJ78184.1 hypothetical protein A1O3_09345 [Capronia epimyces CBS 606.96]